MPKILLVEDDFAFATFLSTFLKKKGYAVTHTSTLQATKEIIQQTEFKIVIADMRLPDTKELEIIPIIKAHSQAKIIMISNYAEVNLAVSAIKNGAYDYLEKPIRGQALLALLHQLETEGASKKVSIQPTIKKKKIDQKGKTSFVQGTSSASKILYETIDLVAPTEMSVLVFGESGTGKEHVAKIIHEKSHRNTAPFIAVDCGAIPKEIAGSEFFGHVKGSFTGALNNKIGFFEAANGGTLFLDEIGNLSYELQAKLLRAVQERKIRPIGAPNEIAVDIRIISATNIDLREAVRKGDFREDLWHRINEFTIVVPSLQERIEDLSLYIDDFVIQANEQLNKSCKGLSNSALKLAKRNKWSGNLRELQNVIKKSVLICPNNAWVEEEHLERFLQGDTEIEISSSNFAFKNETEEKKRLKVALKRAKGNKAKAARILQIDRKTLYNKLKKYQIEN